MLCLLKKGWSNPKLNIRFPLIRHSDVLQLLNHNLSITKSIRPSPAHQCTYELPCRFDNPAIRGFKMKVWMTSYWPRKLLAQFKLSGIFPTTWTINGILMEVGWNSVTTLGILTENPAEIPKFRTSLKWLSWWNELDCLYVVISLPVRIWDF